MCVQCTVFVLWELHSSEGNGYYIWDMVFLTSLKLCVALLEQIIVLQSSCLFVCINKLSSPGISCFHLQSRLSSLRYSRLSNAHPDMPEAIWKTKPSSRPHQKLPNTTVFFLYPFTYFCRVVDKNDCNTHSITYWISFLRGFHFNEYSEKVT